MLSIIQADPLDPTAAALIDELSAHLLKVTGRDGRTNFHPEEVMPPAGAFLVACRAGEPVGCGGLRRQAADTAEVKRLYVRAQRQGIGSALVAALQAEALHLGYHRLVVETGAQNIGAVAFYEKHGFHCTENYGPYVGRTDSLCFEKLL